MSTPTAAHAVPETVLDNILAVDTALCDVTVCLASVVNDVTTFQRLQLSDPLTTSFREIARDLFQRLGREKGKQDLVLKKYDAGSKPDKHEVEFVDLVAPDFTDISGQIAPLMNLRGIANFDAADTFIDGVKFYVIALQQPGASPIYLFRTYSPKKEIHRSRTFGALFGGGVFHQVSQPLFLFDPNVDCICRDDVVFILNKNNFQKIFNFFALVLRKATETIEEIRNRVKIANFADLEAACHNHLMMLIKLKNIASKPYLRTITMGDIQRVLTEFPHIQVTIANVNGEDQLVFDPKDKWAILRLLDDDYLRSIMTGNGYEVTGKRPT